MKIFHQIKDSIYGPEYYKQIAGEMRLTSSIKYLAKLSLLLAVLAVIIFIVFYPKINKFAHDASGKIVDSYPADLEIDIKAGQASTNKPEPLFIPMPDFGFDMDEIKEEHESKNLFTINTKENFSTLKFKEYSTYVLLSKNELAVLKDARTGEVQIMPLSESEDTKVTKSTVLSIRQAFESMLPTILIIAAFVIFVSAFVMFFSTTLIVNFLYALFIWIFAKILKHSLSYKKSYQIGIHASTLANLLGLLAVFGIVLAFGEFLVKLIIILLVVYINLFKDKLSASEPELVRDVEATPTQ